MKMILRVLIASCILFNNLTFCVAQSMTANNIFALWADLGINHAQILKEKGFVKVYGGPKKEGGNLFLYHHKKSKEYLFIHFDEQNVATQINYYLPNRESYTKLISKKTALSAKENIALQGLTYYEDGKKYYHVIFSKMINKQ